MKRLSNTLLVLIAIFLVTISCGVGFFAGAVFAVNMEAETNHPNQVVEGIHTQVSGTLTAAPTERILPTNTRKPTLTKTPTVIPTNTPLPTYTPLSTYTMIPSNTPYPTYTPEHPIGSTGKCKDGTYTYAEHSQGACSHHDGILEWWGPWEEDPPTETATIEPTITASPTWTVTPTDFPTGTPTATEIQPPPGPPTPTWKPEVTPTK